MAASKAKQPVLDEESGSYNKAQFIQEGITDPTGTHYSIFIFAFTFTFTFRHTLL